MSDRPEPNPVTRFFGGLMMAAGGVIAVTSGLCSVVLTVMALGDAIQRPSGNVGELLTLGVPMVLLFGGIPFAVGLGLFFIGRKLYREHPVAPPAGPP